MAKFASANPVVDLMLRNGRLTLFPCELFLRPTGQKGTIGGRTAVSCESSAMFGIGFWEMVVIAIVVVLLCAPVIVAVSVVAAILILNKKRP
jgi:hypothetical protein